MGKRGEPEMRAWWRSAYKRWVKAIIDPQATIEVSHHVFLKTESRPRQPLADWREQPTLSMVVGQLYSIQTVRRDGQIQRAQVIGAAGQERLYMWRVGHTLRAGTAAEGRSCVSHLISKHSPSLISPSREDICLTSSEHAGLQR